MKKIFACFAVLAAVSLTSSVASAATACSSLALPVNVVTSILASTGCDAGSLNFSNFAVSSSPLGMTVSLSGVTVSTGEVDLAFQLGGFSFTLPSNPTPDLRLTYEVKGSSITGVNNLFGGSNGTTILETVCDSKGISGGACAGTQLGQLLNGSPNSNPSITFASQTDIWIIKDIGVSAGFDGRVIVSDFTNSHETSGVPEPMTLSMMGAGLLGLSLISRRRKKS